MEFETFVENDPATAAVRRLIDVDPVLVGWRATRSECISALSRRRRDGHISAVAEKQARQILAVLGGAWFEV